MVMMYTKITFNDSAKTTRFDIGGKPNKNKGEICFPVQHIQGAIGQVCPHKLAPRGQL